MVSKINQLIIIRKQKEEIEQKEKELLKPELVGLSVIPVISDWIWDLTSEIQSRFPPNYYLVAVVALLYSPESLIGNSFKRGIRNMLAGSMDCSKTAISHSLQRVKEWYFIYKDFQEDVDYLSNEVLRRIEEYGILKN